MCDPTLLISKWFGIFLVERDGKLSPHVQLFFFFFFHEVFFFVHPKIVWPVWVLGVLESHARKRHISIVFENKHFKGKEKPPNYTVHKWAMSMLFNQGTGKKKKTTLATQCYTIMNHRTSSNTAAAFPTCSKRHISIVFENKHFKGKDKPPNYSTQMSNVNVIQSGNGKEKPHLATQMLFIKMNHRTKPSNTTAAAFHTYFEKRHIDLLSESQRHIKHKSWTPKFKNK